MRVRLIENAPFVDYDVSKLTERDEASGVILRMEGVFARYGEKNQNGRIYTEDLWEDVLGPNSPAMRLVSERGMFGELDHPDDGRTLLQRTSHVITGLKKLTDGTVRGVAEIFDTAAGRDLAGIVRGRGKVGISSRGDGDLEESPQGDLVRNYELHTFDFVHNPSTRGAYPQRVTEALTKEGRPDDMSTMQEYERLERSVQELASLPLKGVAPQLRRLAEAQAKEAVVSVSRAVQASGDLKPLFEGLLTEAQAARRRITEAPYDYTDAKGGPTIGILRALQNNSGPDNAPVKQTAATSAGEPTPLPDQAEVPTNPEEKENMGMPQTTESKIRKSAVSAVLRAAVREAEDEMDKADAEDEGDEFAADTAQKAESRISGFAKKFMAEEDDSDEVDLPPPPDDVVAQESDDADADDEELTDDEGQPLPPTEAKLVKSLKRLVHENKKLRYERKVTEMIAGKALAGVVRRSRSRQVPVTEATVSVNGKELSVHEAAEVIRELSRMVREARSTSRSRVSESVEEFDAPVIRTSRARRESISESRLSEPSDRGTSSLMEGQARLGASLAKKIGGN